MGTKGDWPRRDTTSGAEGDLRDEYRLTEGKMGLKKFKRRLAKIRKQARKK